MCIIYIYIYMYSYIPVIMHEEHASWKLSSALWLWQDVCVFNSRPSPLARVLCFQTSS